MNMTTLETSIAATAQALQVSIARKIILAYENRNTGNERATMITAKGRIMSAALSKGLSMPNCSIEGGVSQ
jgi:hypothetical protein